MCPKTLELLLKLFMLHRPEFKHLNSQHRAHFIWTTNKFGVAEFYDSVRGQSTEAFSRTSVPLDFSNCKARNLKHSKLRANLKY